MSYLGFDVGAKRIGVAISRSGIIAEPLTTIDASAEDTEDTVRRLIQIEQPSVLVVGLPERIGHRSKLVETFIDLLSVVVPATVSIITVDETLTTKEAERLSHGRADTDALAATLILEQYLSERAHA